MTGSDDNGPAHPIASRWLLAIALAQILVLVWYLVVPLPSTGASQIRRGYLLIEADSYIRTALAQLSHPGNLVQRLPILAASSLVAGACWVIGSLALRGLGLLRRDLGTWERLALAFVLGGPIVGGLTMIGGRAVGLSVGGIRGLLGGAVALALMVAGWNRLREVRQRSSPAGPRRIPTISWAVGPFLILMGLGALLPTIEFDALEYHLQGPKEFFLDGRVEPLRHNVYTSMPFVVEMLTTLAMEVAGDWWLGALAGQEVIAWFAPAAAILIAATATRISGSARAGGIAALVYLSTPWIFRAGTTPFVEGPLCALHAALVWAVVWLGWFGRRERSASPPPLLAGGLLIGLLAGGAMAVKYPAVVTAVIPAAVVVAVVAVRERSFRLVVGFAVGCALVAGPWLVKNMVETGNPVYPLAWSVFGGTDWDASREGRWQTAHGSRPVEFGLLIQSLVDAAGRSDWQSILYLAFAPLAWLGARTRRASWGLLGYSATIFAVWWLLTHRLDRFWLPMLPPLAVLAGLGFDAGAARSRGFAVWLGVVATVGLAVNLIFCSTELAGPTAWTADLATVRADTYGQGTPSLAALDDALPPNAHPLVIGQAGTFGLRHRPTYNTVFDPDTLEAVARDQPANAIADDLHARGITHVYVDWAEVERYRQPGNYGFTPFIVPAVFDRLVEAGVLGPPTRIGERQILYPVR